MCSLLPDFCRKENAGVARPDMLIVAPHLTHPMKFLILLPILATAFFASSCRTITPLDPMTMKQASKCLPDYSRQSSYGVRGSK